MTDLFTPPVKARKLTAVDVRAALARRFRQPEWALLFEVGDATGAQHTRFADAVAMSLWPSRGLTLEGMEIKVSRSDWLHECKQPEKAEKIAAYCDFWSLVTVPGVATLEEIPPAWGWYEFDGSTVAIRKQATKTDAKVCDRRFLAALLRRASKMDDVAAAAEVESRMAAMRDKYDEDVERAVERRFEHRDDLVKAVAEFEAASGIKIFEPHRWDYSAADLGRTMKAVLASGIDRSHDGLQAAADGLRQSAERIDKAMADAGFAPRPKTETTKRRRFA